MSHPMSRPLSHDEQKAAEAAFAGRPFNPGWSQSARRVYDGILQVKQRPVAGSAVPAIPSIAQGSPGTPIDLTPLARTVGLTTPVFISPVLWHHLSTERTDAMRLQRARDLVLALHLALYAAGAPHQGLQFPALSWSPNATDPAITLFLAVWRTDPQYRGSYLIRTLDDGMDHSVPS